MKLGLSLGVWGAEPPTGTLDRVLEAERLGYDTVFTSENYGSDAYTPLSWWGGRTSSIRLGTSIIPIAARTPTATAMAAMTLDHLSQGRHVLGLGASGPGVVEGWFGVPFDKPLTRTRAYVDVIRQVLSRTDAVVHHGEHYQIPYENPRSPEAAKPLKSIVHPYRADLPIWLGAEGPKNVALCGEIADGWLPMFFAPRAAAMYRSWLNEGFTKRTAPMPAGGFEIASSCRVVVTGDQPAAHRLLDSLRPNVGFYIGGMGTREVNFHRDLFSRMGYEPEVEKIKDLFFEGRRDDAYAAVPIEMVADISLIGTREMIRDGLARWEEAGVTMLVVSPTDDDQLRQIADVVLNR